MIKAIELQNFQSHARTRLDLAQFTAIVGPSSSGKTAVMRGLQWLVYGDWDELYPQDPAKPTAIAIELDNGTKIIRLRHEDTNRAIVTIPGEEPRKYKDFGYIIPGLFDLINFRPIQSGKQKINLNFSTQDEPMFMLSDAYSKPAKAQWLGRLYGAHVVNSMLRLMAKDKKDSEAAVRSLTEGRDDLQARVDAFEDLDRQERLLVDSEASLSVLRGLSGLEGSLKAYKVKLEALRAKRHVLTADTKSIRDDLEKLENLNAIRDKYRYSNNLKAELRGKKALLNADFSAIRSDLEQLSRIRATRQMYEATESAKIRLARKAALLSVDLVALKEKVNLLASLRSFKEKYVEVTANIVLAETKTRKKAEALEKAHAGVKDHIVKDGKCMLCGGATEMSAEHAASSAKLLMGA